MTLPRTGLLRLVAVALVALLGAGCGAFASSSAIARAERAIDGAERVGSERLAPHDYWTARAWLDKARDVSGRAEHGAAERFAETAAERAHAAKAQAIALTGGPATDAGGAR